MLKHSIAALVLLVTALPLSAELTPAQRRQDFVELATLYWKQYGPYEWKRELFGFDMADLRPWLVRVDAAKTDMDFAEICAEYVNSLKDGHVFFRIPSSFQASIGIAADFYDGKLLVENFSTVQFPVARNQVRIGDEVISFDGRPATEEIESLKRLVGNGSTPRFEAHLVSNYLFFRPQSVFPNAPKLGQAAEIVLRHADGTTDTIRTEWAKVGEPLTDFGTLPPFRFGAKVKSMLASTSVRLPEDVENEPWMRSLFELGYSAAPEQVGLQGYGAANPVWAFPQGFVPRLTANDVFVSGTYMWNGKRIGYIRLRNMSPPNFGQALQLFEREITFFQQNTDGLVVDVMRNTGGIIVYGHEIARRLIPGPMTGVGFELRATATRLANLSAELRQNELLGAPSWVIELFKLLVEDVRKALAENRGRTGPLPLNMPSLENIPPADVVYTKPLIVLIDELSVSTADLFPAVMQDNKRGLLVGTRTAGLGGTNGSFSSSPSLMEGSAGVTFGLMVRPNPVRWEKGTTRYIENVGVFPDIEMDYMTTDNLLNRGRPFVTAFSDILVDQINKAAQ